MTTTPNEQYKPAFDAIVARVLARINDRIGSKDVLVAALRPLWTGGVLSETMIRTLFLIPVNDRIRAALVEVRAADDGQHQDIGDKAITLFLTLCEESFRSTQNNGICRDGRPHPSVAVVATLLQNETPNKATQIENKVDDLLVSWGVMLSNALNAVSNARRGNYVSETLVRLFRLMSALQDYAKDPKRFARVRLTTGEVSAPAGTTPNSRRDGSRASFEVDISTRGAVEYASRSYPRNYYGDITMDQDSTRTYLRLVAKLEWLERRSDEGYDEDAEGNDIDDAIDEATQECNDFLRSYERSHYYDAENCDDCDSDDDWDNYDSDTDNEEYESSETDYDNARERILREFRPEINALVTEMEEAAR